MSIQVITVTILVDSEKEDRALDQLDSLANALEPTYPDGAVIDFSTTCTMAIPELEELVRSGAYQPDQAFQEAAVLYSPRRAKELGEDHAYFSESIGWTSKQQGTRIRPEAPNAMTLLAKLQGFDSIPPDQNWSKGGKAKRAIQLLADMENSEAYQDLIFLFI